MLDAGNWPSVKKLGLMSARRLMELSGEKDNSVSRRHREAGQRLASGVLIRDQRPMPPKALARCLKTGLQPEDWFQVLNSKVFFWLTPERLNRQRLACRRAPQIVLVVDAALLLAEYSAVATLTPINTGNALRAAAPRNLSTFVPYERWLVDRWAHEEIPGFGRRPASHRPVELTVEDAVPDILNYVIADIPLAADETLTAHRLAAFNCN